MNLVEVTDIF